jgi:5'-deoxynucleotidase YfbR-like HD superfamily hydrolase
MMERKGDWIQVYTGKRFWVLDPRPEDVDIRDIAHALSLQCRYGGHARSFYSVAEHCVILARWVWETTGDRALAFAALMHDAAEAYLPDLARPTKHFMPEYMQIERILEAVIFPVFNVANDNLAEIKQYDTRILMDERNALFDAPLTWGTECEPLGVELKHWSPAEAEMAFLAMYHDFKVAA